MADEKLTALLISNPLDLDPGNLIYAVEHTDTAPESGGAKVSQLMTNRYMVSASVTSNNLTVAIRHLDGSEPSADRPLYFRIGDNTYAVTAALSVTKNAGTNWFGAGSATWAAQEQDYFVYLGYNLSDGVVIGFALIPYAEDYSDFSTSSTNEKYCAISTITNAASGDPYTVIGRIAATLSAGAGYTWTTPIKSNLNTISRPIIFTRSLSFTPQWTNITVGAGTSEGKYRRHGRQVFAEYRFAYGASGSAVSGDVSFILPAAHGGLGTSSRTILGEAAIWDNGTANYQAQALLTSTNGGAVRVGKTDGTYLSLANLSSTIPMTWANTDELTMKMSYPNA